MQGKLILQDEAVCFEASSKHMRFLQGHNVPPDKKNLIPYKTFGNLHLLKELFLTFSVQHLTWFLVP